MNFQFQFHCILIVCNQATTGSNDGLLTVTYFFSLCFWHLGKLPGVFLDTLLQVSKYTYIPFKTGLRCLQKLTVLREILSKVKNVQKSNCKITHFYNSNEETEKVFKHFGDSLTDVNC